MTCLECSETNDGFLAAVDTILCGGCTLDTPRFAGWAVLELSKLTMFKIYYLFFKSYDGHYCVTPMMTDTDSLVLLIKDDENPLEVMKLANLQEDSVVHFDLSNVYGSCQNKGKLGCLKVEEGKKSYTKESS